MVKRLINKLNNAQGKYEGVIGDVEAEIVDKVEFDFSISWQPSDGFVMIAFDSYNAGLSEVLKVIKEKGKLTEDDYKRHTI